MLSIVRITSQKSFSFANISSQDPVAMSVNIDEVLVLFPGLSEDDITVAGHLIILDVDHDFVVTRDLPEKIKAMKITS